MVALRSDKGDVLDLKPTALENSKDGFGGGEYLFMNATRVDIAGIVGEQKFAAKLGNNTLLAPKSRKKRGDRDYSHAKFSFPNDDEAEGFFWRLGD